MGEALLRIAGSIRSNAVLLEILDGNQAVKLNKKKSEMAISGAIPVAAMHRYLHPAGVPVHARDVCHVDPSEAIKLMLAAFVLASATFAGRFAIIMSR